MEEKDAQKYYCINCGNAVNNLYKKYSETVLKLTECDNCKCIADKYVEYDIVLITVDIILLRITAYRHILHNFKFEKYWRLFLFIVLVESYSEWIFLYDDNNKSKIVEILTEEYLNNFDIYLDDLMFYKITIVTLLKSLLLICFVYLLSKIYGFYAQKTITFVLIAKTITLSSVGIFLLLPALIWDFKVKEINTQFVSLYVTLTKLISYTAACNCPKYWSTFVMLVAVLGQKIINEYCNTSNII
ncbi:unnamed protein product [Brassicogethes aeneus]|uniref:Protein ARV n=1 Tax=Brassicogethes aeneus TaxID=1431903 RepID=A0A9P0FFG6_BRAAE|nr:unnamed protein product [Brassicogethes aeneus]